MTSSENYDAENMQRACFGAILLAKMRADRKPLADALSWLSRAEDLLADGKIADLAVVEACRGELEAAMGNMLLDLGLAEKALESFERASTHFSQPCLTESSDLDTHRAALAVSMGISLVLLGRHAAADTSFAQAETLLSLPYLKDWYWIGHHRGRLSLATGAGPITRRRVEELRRLVFEYELLRVEDGDYQVLDDDLTSTLDDHCISFARQSLQEGLEGLAMSYHLLGLSNLDQATSLLSGFAPFEHSELALDWALIAALQGFALRALARPIEALDALDRANDFLASHDLALQPDLGLLRAWVTAERGVALKELGRPQEAIDALAGAAAALMQPTLARMSDLDGERATNAIHHASALIVLGRLEEALSCFRSAEAHWLGQQVLPLLEQQRFACCLSSMSALLPEMAAEDVIASRAWAVRSSDRLVEMLDLALPEGKIWDDLRGHFALFHAGWLAYCLGGDAAARAMVPRVLAAIQGRRLIAETLEQAMALGEAADDRVKAVLEIKAEMRDLLRELGAAERIHDSGGTGGACPGPMRGDVLATGDGRIPRHEGRIAMIRRDLQSARDRLAAAKRVAAELPEFAVLNAPLSDITTAGLQKRLAPGEALVLAFPLAEKTLQENCDDEVAAESHSVWLWALRGDGSDPVVLRVAAGAVRPGVPDWAVSLPAVVDRWEQFSATMGGRGGVRRGDLDREDGKSLSEALPPTPATPVAGLAPQDKPGSTDADPEAVGRLTGAPPRGEGAAQEVKPAVAVLSAAEMASFWGDLDAALADLVWGPLAATGVLQGVDDILIATAGSLHNLPFSVGRRGDAAGARLLHQSSLASFARSRGLFGARPVAPTTLGKAGAGKAGPDGGRPGAVHRPVVSVLAHAHAEGIPLARVEQRIAARLWAAAGARVISAGDYPLAPDTAVAFAHAACHGMIDTPKGGTRGAHLLLRSAVSERALLAGAPAGAWLMMACVGGRVHDSGLDGNPTGIVAGALGAGSETVVAALPPLRDREAFFFGLLVTLQLAQDVGVGGGPGPVDGPPDLEDAAALAGVILGGAREAGAVTAALPRRVQLALGGVDGIARRLRRLDAGLRRALAEDLAVLQAEPLRRALDPGLTDAAGEALMLSERTDAIRAALEPPSLGFVSARAEGAAEGTAAEDSCLGALSDTTTRTLARCLARTVDAPDPVSSALPLTDRLAAAFGDLSRPFAVLPDPDDPTDYDPAAAGTIAHGIVTFHDPAHNTATKGTVA